MVRLPLTPAQVQAGSRLGAALRTARAERELAEVALAAGISPETLRKIESGRMPTPAFGTVVALSRALGISLEELAENWQPALPETARRTAS
ncbi:helix-turn-helix transcriptional regulator [Nocardia sp. NPDC006630]|uniref:helix-turn-helix transcriptional regulator n=1 Tax=unclassified Nocardia TaxID=2637762 RepID=UPI003245CE93